MRARWRIGALGLGVAIVVAAVVLLVGSKGEEHRALTDHGLRWTVDGSDVVITATDETPASTRARLRGRLVVGCLTSGPQGSLQMLARARGDARFERGPSTARVRLSPRLRRIDACSLERPGDPDDISTARFTPDPPSGDGESMLIIR